LVHATHKDGKIENVGSYFFAHLSMFFPTFSDFPRFHSLAEVFDREDLALLGLFPEGAEVEN
jgi:hypothetical protein